MQKLLHRERKGKADIIQLSSRLLNTQGNLLLSSSGEDWSLSQLSHILLDVAFQSIVIDLFRTVKTYMHILAHFTTWLTVPLEEVTHNDIGSYVDHLLKKRLSPKTITCHLQTHTTLLRLLQQ